MVIPTQQDTTTFYCSLGVLASNSSIQAVYSPNVTSHQEFALVLPFTPSLITKAVQHSQAPSRFRPPQTHTHAPPPSSPPPLTHSHAHKHKLMVALTEAYILYFIIQENKHQHTPKQESAPLMSLQQLLHQLS